MAADERSTIEGRDTLYDGDGRETLPNEEGRAKRSRTQDDDDDPLDAFGDLGPGSKLGGRYLLESVIGKGATGVVFEASHLVIGKRVAMKCLYPQHSASPTSVERFFREAKIAATVEHPNVIAVFDGGKEGDTLFLTMERLHGESLGDRLDRGAVPAREAIELFVAIMDGVAAVHERGVVHRDLKPDNIFLARIAKSDRVVPKVLDFGISKLKEPGLRELTRVGTVMGTPFYMAPEQITNTRDVDARADVYSLGVMLYEALTGDVPYADESVLGIFKRVQSGDTTPIDRLREQVPEPIARVVEIAMRPDRERRFGSVTEMRDALATAALADTDPSTARPANDEKQAIIPDDDPDPQAIEHPRSAPIPLWVWWALGGAGAITFVSIVVAVVALAI